MTWAAAAFDDADSSVGALMWDSSGVPLDNILMQYVSRVRPRNSTGLRDCQKISVMKTVKLLPFTIHDKGTSPVITFNNNCSKRGVIVS